MKKTKTIDLTILLIYPIIASILSLFLKINTLGLVFVFLILPSLYLSLRNQVYIKKTAIFSAVISLPVIIIIEYIAHLTGTWFVAHTSFPFRLFKFVTIEAISWAYFLVYYIIIFYEYFFNHHKSKNKWQPQMKYLAILVLIAITIFTIIFFTCQSILKIPYFYLYLGIIGILIPTLIELFKHPKLSAKFFKTASYFFFFALIFEITTLKLDLVEFRQTEFIGWVSVLDVRFPFEELLFWCMLFAMATLSYYEFFDDDQK